jgi:hypothetical protein
VVIGGHYFDLRDSAFTLTPRDGGTELRIDVSWRVSTRFNWYADRVAQLPAGRFLGAHPALLQDAQRRRRGGGGMNATTRSPSSSKRSEPGWEKLGDVIRRHYTMAPFSDDYVCVRGTMNEVHHAPWAALLMPFGRLFGALVPYTGTDVPIEVHYRCRPRTTRTCTGTASSTSKAASPFTFARTWNTPRRAAPR